MPSLGLRPGSRAAQLLGALIELADATDALTIAVERRDLPGLVAATDRAGATIPRIEQLTATLTPDERAELDPRHVAVLNERLAVAARRNAYLIERAWALDAATLRLLMSVGSTLGATDPTASTYAAPGAPAGWIDRSA